MGHYMVNIISPLLYRKGFIRCPGGFLWRRLRGRGSYILLHWYQHGMALRSFISRPSCFSPKHIYDLVDLYGRHPGLGRSPHCFGYYMEQSQQEWVYLGLRCWVRGGFDCMACYNQYIERRCHQRRRTLFNSL
jgi:hypothetical protein